MKQTSSTLNAPQAGGFSPSLCYASGETPMRGDLIVSVENLKPIYARANHPENDETWIVTTVCDDMVRAKCERAPNWRQAFYVSKMNLAKRSSENRANRKRNVSRQQSPPA